PTSAAIPYTTLFRSRNIAAALSGAGHAAVVSALYGRSAASGGGTGFFSAPAFCRYWKFPPRTELGCRTLFKRSIMAAYPPAITRSEEHTSELQSREN